MADIFEILDGTPEEQKYLRVDEQSDYIDVTCDGYVVRMYSSNTGGIDFRSSEASVIYGNVYDQFWDGANSYSVTDDFAKTVEVLETTPVRAVVRIAGNFYNSSASYLTNSTTTKSLVTVYPDRMTIDFEWEKSASITVGTDALFTIMGFDKDTITNASKVYENSGVESIISNYTTATSADYLAIICDEMTISHTVLEDEIPFEHRSVNTGAICLGLDTDNGDFSSGTHKTSVVYTIDSADREYGGKMYSETERLEIGDQYKDFSLFS